MVYRIIALFLVGGFFVLLYLNRVSIVEHFAFRVEDTKFPVRQLLGLTPKPSERIVVIAIDEKSVNKLGRWPWSRKVIASLIDKLSYAKVVALDIVFSEPEDPESDRMLAESIARHGSVILGFFFRPESTERENPESLYLMQDSEFLRFKLKSERVGLLELSHVELSLPMFMENSLAVGFLNAEPDHDAIYRKYSLAHMFKGSIYLPLALQMIRFYDGKDVEMVLSGRGIDEFVFRGKKIPIYDGRKHRINFYREEDITVLPAVDVIEGAIPPEFFKDKAVVVGATEIGIYDVRPTPVNPIMPGVYLHAMTFSNFDKFHFIRYSKALDTAVIVIVSVLVFLIALRKKFSKRLLLYFILLLIYPSVSYGSFSVFSFDLNLFYPVSAILVSVVAQEGIIVLFAEKNIRELRRAFSSYVSPQLLEIISKNPDRLNLGGEKRVITVLFSDIRGFTTLSEGLKPEDLVNLLNEFLTPMTQIILKNGGMLDKYIGDAIMAVFNAPVDIDRHADRACRSALEMVRALDGINTIFKDTYNVKLDIGIGINTGEAVVGNMGSEQRFDYTAIGDTVNLASRLEGLNKLYHTRIIISENTKKDLTEEFLTRTLDVVVVKGKKEPVRIYELMEDTEENRLKAKEFNEAIEEYFRGNFESAMVMFEELSIRFGDKTSAVFLKRCSELMANPPDDWRGVYVAKEK